MGTFLHPVTPATVSPAIRVLCDEVVYGSVPEYVECHPSDGAAVDDCFKTVEDHVRTQGGHVVIGWSIWEQPALFIEAEFHAVWGTDSDGLLDIARKKRPVPRILFIKDPTRRYEGRQVSNVRRPLRRHPAVLGFINAAEREFEFMNRGPRAHQHGDISVSGVEAIEYQRIQEEKRDYYLKMLRLHPEIEPYDPCWCSSGKKVKWCHGVAAQHAR